MIENLNKENFFNEMQKKYPKAMDKLYKWIDEYKESVECHLLFLKGETKFQNIPFEMQVGVIMKWYHENRKNRKLGWIL